MRTPEQSRAAYTYLRPNDVAARLNTSRSHVLEMIKHGILDAINIGVGKRPEYRIVPESLDAFERAQRKKEQAAA